MSSLVGWLFISIWVVICVFVAMIGRALWFVSKAACAFFILLLFLGAVL